MSKYHKLRIAFAKEQDWTTEKGIAAALRDILRLSNYGTEFQILLGGMPIDEDAARRAIIDEVTSPPLVEEYRRVLQKMVLDEGFESWDVYVESYLGRGLEFEHGDFRRPISLAGFEVVTGAKEVERRRKHRSKTQIDKEDRAQSLKKKLEDTQNTHEADYLAHANYSGYLVRNTTMRFFAKGEGQRGASTETKIRGITLPELQEFIDSTGRALSAISTHVDSDLVKTESGDEEVAVKAVHAAFAQAIIDFLDMEQYVDIDSIKRRYREEKADSAFRSIEHWGADRKTVLTKLIERRNMNPDDITEAFEMGYRSDLLT